MVLGVLAFLAVTIRVTIRPEISIIGSEELWIKCVLFATIIVLLAYSSAKAAHDFWALLVLHSLCYAPPFLYLYATKGAIAGVAVLVSLSLTVLVSISKAAGKDQGWPDFIYALWLAVGLSATLGQHGIIIDAADYRTTLDLVPTEIPLRSLLVVFQLNAPNLGQLLERVL